jgi:hypothetical protein
MIPPRHAFLAAATLALVGAAVAATAAAGRMAPAAAPKPLIGPPTAVPSKPQAGEAFAVSFTVTSSTTTRR